MGPRSRDVVARCLDQGSICINPILYSEISAGYDMIEELDRSLLAVSAEREELPYDAAFLAGKVFVQYKRRDGMKRSPLPDCYIGAHAAVRGYRLPNCDTARFTTYFPKLDVIGPE